MAIARLTSRNVWCRVDADDSAFALLDKTLKVWIKGIERTWAYRSHKIDGYEHHFNFKTGIFRAGLRDEIAQLLRDHGYDVEIDDQRVRPAVTLSEFHLLGEMKDWKHQKAAIDACVAAGRGTVHHATGTGKTDTFIGLAQVVGVRTLILSNQKSITVQTMQRTAARLGLPEKKVGLFGDGKKRDGHIVCATFQTISSLLRGPDVAAVLLWLKTFDMIIVDEGHHLVAETYQDVFDACSAYFRFAFSATPFKSKNKDERARLHVVGSCGPIIHTYGAGEAAKDKIITRAKVEMYQWHDHDDPAWSWQRDDFEIDDDLFEWSGRKKGRRKPEKGLYQIAIVENKERNLTIADTVALMVEDGRSTLVLVRQAKHGYELYHLLADEFEGKVGYARGATSQDERERLFNALGDGTLPVLIATTIADEGINVPGIDALVLAGGGKADHKVIQQIGRGSRAKDGKKYLLVADFFDTHSKLMWMHSKARLAAYESDPNAYSVKVVKL